MVRGGRQSGNILHVFIFLYSLLSIHLWLSRKTEHWARLSFAQTQHRPSYAFSLSTRTRGADSRGERGSLHAMHHPLQNYLPQEAAVAKSLEIFKNLPIYGRKKNLSRK